MHRSRRRLPALALAFASVVWIHQANAAAFVTFTNRAAWEAAIAGVITNESLNGITSDQTLPFDVGPFSISAAGPFSFSNGIEAFDPSGSNIQQDRNIDGTTYYQGDTDAGTTYTLSFDFPIFAFGFDHTSLGSEGTGEFLDILGISTPIPISATGQVGFFGVLNTGPESFTTVTFRGDDGAHGLDNFAFASRVPEPGTLALLGLGLAGLAAARRRKQ